MKIKTEYYAIFYKDGKKWRGPAYGDLFTEQDIIRGGDVSFEDLLKDEARSRKKKVKLFKQLWKSVKKTHRKKHRHEIF